MKFHYIMPRWLCWIFVAWTILIPLLLIGSCVALICIARHILVIITLLFPLLMILVASISHWSNFFRELRNNDLSNQPATEELIKRGDILRLRRTYYDFTKDCSMEQLKDMAEHDMMASNYFSIAVVLTIFGPILICSFSNWYAVAGVIIILLISWIVLVSKL